MPPERVSTNEGGKLENKQSYGEVTLRCVLYCVPGFPSKTEPQLPTEISILTVYLLLAFFLLPCLTSSSSLPRYFL